MPVVTGRARMRRALTIVASVALALGIVAPAGEFATSARAATCIAFAALPPVASAGIAEDIAVGEFNGDAHLDVAIANFGIGLNRVSTQTNDGFGDLSWLRSFSAGRPPDSLGQNGVATGDFDEDGRLDLVVVKLWENTLTVMVDDGAFGTFRPHASFATGSRPFDVAVGDIDLDGHLDAVVSNFGSSNLSLFFGDGTGSFPASQAIGVGGFPKAVVVGDLNLDGQPEIVATQDAGITIAYRTTGASISTKQVAVPGDINSVAVAPMNGDLLPDLVVADGLSPNVRVLLNAGTPFSAAAPLIVGPALPTGSNYGAAIGGVAVGDLDGNGTADVAVAVSNGQFAIPATEPAVQTLSGDGIGGLAPGAAILLGRDPKAIELADMNGDAALDVVVADGGDGVYVARNTCVPAVPLDFGATGIEVVQVVQDLANSVPLIEGKRTIVRGYAGTTRAWGGVTARLVRLDAIGNEIGSLAPMNPFGRISLRVAPSRALGDDSFRFDLPESWTHGTVRLRLQVSPAGVPYEASTANNVLETSVMFSAARTLKITLVDYRWGLCAGSDVEGVSCKPGAAVSGFTDPFPVAEYAAIEAQLRQRMPVAAIQVKRIEVKDSQTMWAKSVAPSPGAVELNRVIAMRQGLETADPGTIFLWLNRDFGGGVAYRYDPLYPERQWDAIANGASVAVHETGHLLGRGHTNCSGNEASVDGYPYPGGKIGGPAADPEQYFGYSVPDATIGFGAVVAATTGDEMGYCNPRWPSDFSYKRWRTEIETRPGFVDPTGDFLVVGGTVSADGTRASLSEVQRVTQVASTSSLVPGPLRLRLRDSAGTTLATYPFTPGAVVAHDNDGDLAFNEVVPWMATTKRISVEDGSGAELAFRMVTPNIPVVATVSQDGGPLLPATGNVTVSWSGSDADGDALTAAILYSTDDGVGWTGMARGIRGSSYSVDVASLTGTMGGATGRFRVLLSDGIQTGGRDTAAFAAPGHAPTVRIASPRAGSRFALGQSVPLQAVAFDAEDGVLDPAAIAWSSSLDGSLGTGRLLVAPLSEGNHSLTAIASDSEGQTASISTTVRVAREPALGAPPIARAGPDRTTTEGSSVSLDGSASSDPDGDPLAYSWQVIGAPGDDVALVDAATAHPSFVATDDGTYELRLFVSDGLNAPVFDDLTVTVANVRPTVSITSPVAGQLFPVGAVSVIASFVDPGPLEDYLCTVNWDLDQPGALQPGTLDEATRTCTGTRTLGAGVYTISVAVDDGDEIGTATVQIVVYDPTAGFVTGGGWIHSPAGAYSGDSTLAGRAEFGFVSAYKKGATVPEGRTEFSFDLGRLRFTSSSYQWLVVAGDRAQYKGVGQVNGSGDYGFLLSAEDGQLRGGTDPDRFRMKIWDRATGLVVYDNVRGASDDLDSADPTVIGGGSIVIHPTRPRR